MKKPSLQLGSLIGSWKWFDMSKKALLLFLALETLLLLFFPMIRVSTGDSAMSIWLFSGSFIGLAILTLLLLIVLRGWNFHHGMRQFIHVVFWFKDNDHLLNFGLLLTIVSALLGMWNTVGVTNVVTSSLSTTTRYSISLFILFVLLIYSLFLMLQEARLLSKTRFMSIIKRGKSEEKSDHSVQSLFEDAWEEEEA